MAIARAQSTGSQGAEDVLGRAVAGQRTGGLFLPTVLFVAVSKILFLSLSPGEAGLGIKLSLVH